MKLPSAFLQNLFVTLGTSVFASLATAGTPGAAAIAYGPGSEPVPTMGGTMLIALAVLLALVAFRLLKNRPRSGSNMVIAIAAVTALVSGAGGIKLISDAHATRVLDMSNAKGGVVNVPGPGSWIVANSTDVPQSITSISYAPGCSNSPAPVLNVPALNGGSPFEACSTSTTLAPQTEESCEIVVFCDAEE